MEQTVITAEIRQKTSKGENRRLRKKGKIPAVLYGKGTENMLLAIPTRQIQPVADAESAQLMKLQIQGDGERAVLLKDAQYDHLHKNIKHADLQEVSLTERLTVTVPLVLLGEDMRANDGGIVQQLLREIDVECLPIQIPEQISTDISALEIGQSLAVGELVAEDGITIITPAEEVVVSIVAPTKAASDEEETEEEASEEEEVQEDA